MTERERATGAFLDAAGWGGIPRAALAGDASDRRYERLVDGGRRAVLMDARTGDAARPFAAMAAWLRAAGYSAPEILAADFGGGLLLCEDLGDDLFARIAATGGDVMPLYAAAVDLLVDLHRRPSPDLPPYDAARLLEETGRFLLWYVPAVTGVEASAEMRESFDALWRGLVAEASADEKVVVLRDYHAENLIWLPGRKAHARVGLLDFQDAVVGPRAYDLVSLLEDARRDVGLELTAAMTARYLAATGLENHGFRRAYAILSAQRNTKIIGVFTRLWRRDGNPQYLHLIPRVWALLERDLADPTLAAARQWYDRHIPVRLRIAPQPEPERLASPA